MVVREVRFARAAVVGTADEPVPTGATIVKLSLAEGWMSMVWREMKAQQWGIAGGIVAGVLLAVLTRIGGGMLRRIRKLILLNRPNRDESVEEAERKVKEEGGAGSA